MPTTLSRSLLTILIPGAIAVAPWLLALVQRTDATLGLKTYPTLGNALLFVIAAVAGSIFEGLGSYIEVRWDKDLESDYQVKENWHIYLARTFQHEPVGYRYISRLATTLYFELSMVFAAPLFVAGAGVLAGTRFPAIAWPLTFTTPMIMILAVSHFHDQAKCTHKVLCETRRELNARLEKAVGHQPPSAPGV